MSARRAVVALVSGTVFGLGLSVAQMTDPRKVLNFLDITGTWDPSLLFVLGGAVALTAVAFRFVLKRPAPLFDRRFQLPLKTAPDRRLIAGSAIFGVGWGLAGYCPGPAFAALAVGGNHEVLWLLPALLVGAALQRWQAAATAPDGARPVGAD